MCARLINAGNFTKGSLKVLGKNIAVQQTFVRVFIRDL